MSKKEIEPIGDGKLFYEAYLKSQKTGKEVCAAMGISNGTLYNYFNSEELNKKIKHNAATALGLTVSEIFVDISNIDNLQIKESQKKEVIALGKHVPLRLNPEEYSEAFGDWPGLPMYNNEITASFVEVYKDNQVFTPQYYLHDPRFKDCDFGAIITGDSMHSEIRHGDWVMCKEIIDKTFIVYGDIYYIVSTNGLQTCKYVNADPENKNNYLLVPRNQSISPSPIPREMVHRIFRVRGILRGY